MTDLLFALQDPMYRDFQRKLIPNVDPETIIGVRTLELRKLAKQVDHGFRKQLPHTYFEENQIHVFSLEKMKDFDCVIEEVEAFLPYVNNWATCDQLRPKAFTGYREHLLSHIRSWLRSDHPYTVRFAMEMLMLHYLGDSFDREYPSLVLDSISDDYYVQMMAAWYFAEGLSVRYAQFLPYLTQAQLPAWVHNKTIQKAVESFRITTEQKAYLKTLRIK